MSHLGFDPVQQPLVENDLADELERPLSAPPPPGFVNSEDRNKLANELLHEEMEASNSFSNIAAMLGQGLAESLEESNELSYHRMARHAANRLMGNNNDPVLPQPKNRTNIAYARKSTPNNHHNNFGFPGSLSTPPRATTPIQMYPGQWDARRNATTSNDIGMNVVEPEEFDVEKFASDPTVGSDSNGSRRELERGIKNLWSPEAREFRPQGGPHSTTSSLSEPNDSKSSSDPHLDLEPYIWDGRVASRTLAIIHVSWLHDKDVRSACETYGVLESFRADFSSRGVYFVSYYDIRSAQYASVELQSILQRLSVMQRSSEEVIVKYCLSLSASSQFDESQMVVCNLPPEVSEYHLKSMLSSYGALRSVVKQDNGNYLIEFQNLQDTKQAMLEIDSSQPWGPLVGVEVNLRDQFERQRGRELLALIGRWRHGMTRRNPAGQSDFGRAPQQRNEFPPFQEPPQRQFVLGPDGRYTEVFVQNPGNNFQSYNSMDKRSFQQPQQILQGPNGQIYVATQVAQPRSGHTSYSTMNNSASSASFSGQAQQSNPYFSYVSSDATSVSGRSHNSHHSHRSGHSSHGTEDRDNRHLMLDLEHVESGEDTRTSLMVRNIPNKYTQQMLLSEFEELGHGPGVIDFFYLPIDFKNRCNRGYAFINFVSYNDILAFHRRYFGKHWRTFNSDKICDITYARIQGKEAMLKRFENSALMEKDDEYKPLVFASDGPDKGKRLPFPDPNRAGGGQYHC